MKLAVMIVDDEPLARLRLRSLLAEPMDLEVEVVGEAASGPQMLELLGQHACDAVLLDIRLPGLDGLEWASRLRQRPGAPAVVFVSAHDNHALRAFELDAADYLTKPVQRARLAEALRRVAQRRGSASSRPLEAPEGLPVLVIRERQRLLRIPLDEIISAHAQSKVVSLRTMTRHHVLDESLTDLEARLGPGFLRVHRNALVARRAVRELQHRPSGPADEAWAVRLFPGNEWVPVSRRQLGAVRDALSLSSTPASENR